MSIDGTLLQMKFDNAGLKSGEKTEIKVAVEELAAESEELTETAECKNGTVFIGKSADNTDDTPKKTGKTTAGKNSAAGSTSKSGKVKTGDTLKMEEALEMWIRDRDKSQPCAGRRNDTGSKDSGIRRNVPNDRKRTASGI